MKSKAELKKKKKTNNLLRLQVLLTSPKTPTLYLAPYEAIQRFCSPTNFNLKIVIDGVSHTSISNYTQYTMEKSSVEHEFDFTISLKIFDIVFQTYKEPLNTYIIKS